LAFPRLRGYRYATDATGRNAAAIRSDQGPEFIAEVVKGWIAGGGTKTAYIEKASAWENGYVESFNGKLETFGNPAPASWAVHRRVSGGVQLTIAFRSRFMRAAEPATAGGCASQHPTFLILPTQRCSPQGEQLFC